jgi:hypothetical protein
MAVAGDTGDRRKGILAISIREYREVEAVDHCADGG